MISRDEARRHLEALAGEPRPAGSDPERRAREHCSAVLARAGFSATEQSFDYSAWPGLYATPVFGALAILAVLAAAIAGQRGQGDVALLILLAGAAAMTLAGGWLARYGVTRLPILRRRSSNLIARRGEPRVWLVAHLDSKSQPVPMLLRAGGITLLGVLCIGALALAVSQTVGWAAIPGEGGGPERWWRWIAAAGVIAGAPVVASFVGSRSPGAVDDASGVATVLLAANAATDVPMGVLLTSAEELGLAGARAWVASEHPGIAINCDGVDDAGRLSAMYSGPAPGPLLASFARASAREGARARVHRVLPGVLVDGVALADAGWQVITISKGSVTTLRRIHTPGDDLEALTGDGVAEAARVLARMVQDIGGAR